MTVLILVRHGRTAANASGLLAGWTPGISLDDKGTEQARKVGHRLAGTDLTAVVASPLDRCQETAAAILGAREQTDPGSGIPVLHTDEQVGECHYGAWTGRPLKELAREPLWRDIQDRPSTVTFPPHDDYRHESIAGMQERAVGAITRWDRDLARQHGRGAVWAVVSHGDVIKSLVAWALDSPLDRFQRIVIDPASVTVVSLTPERPFVLRVNDTGSEPVDLVAVSRALNQAPDGAAGDADVGGGAGTD